MKQKFVRNPYQRRMEWLCSFWKRMAKMQKEFAVVVEAVDYSSGPGLRVMWQGQSWHAEVLEGPNFFEKGDRVEVVGRSGTSLKVVRIDS